MAAFTTIAAAAGLAISAGTTAASFAQANKQKKLQKKAEDAAEKSMKEARKALGVNYFEELAVQKEKQTTRTAMGKELSDLQKMTAQEESRLRDVGVQLDLAEAQGAQEAAAQAEDLRAQAFREGIQGATSMVQQGLSMVPLYQQNMAAQKAAVGGMNFTPEEFAKFGTIGQAGGLAGSGQEFSDLDFASVGNMSNREFRQFKKSLTPQQQAMIFGTSQFADAYKNFDTSSINPFQLRQ